MRGIPVLAVSRVDHQRHVERLTAAVGVKGLMRVGDSAPGLDDAALLGQEVTRDGDRLVEQAASQRRGAAKEPEAPALVAT